MFLSADYALSYKYYFRHLHHIYTYYINNKIPIIEPGQAMAFIKDPAIYLNEKVKDNTTGDTNAVDYASDKLKYESN